MSDSAYPLQVGIVAALLADSTVSGAVSRQIFDPLQAQGMPYPLIEIGNDEIVPNADGQTESAWVLIEAYDDGPGARLIVKQIAGAIRNVLAPPGQVVPAVTVSGFSVVSCVLHSAKYPTVTDPTDPTAVLACAVLQYRFQLAPTA